MAGGGADVDVEPEVLERDPTLGGPRAAGWEVYVVAVLGGAASLVLGIVPGPLFDLARDAGSALPGLF